MLRWLKGEKKDKKKENRGWHCTWLAGSLDRGPMWAVPTGLNG